MDFRGQLSTKRQLSTVNRAFRTVFLDRGEFSAALRLTLHEIAGGNCAGLGKGDSAGANFYSKKGSYAVSEGIQIGSAVPASRLSSQIWTLKFDHFPAGGEGVDYSSGRPALARERFDPALPGNAAKYEAVERLAALADEAGCSLPALAMAFPGAHPAVTSVIIGPRTLGAAIAASCPPGKEMPSSSALGVAVSPGFVSAAAARR